MKRFMLAVFVFSSLIIYPAAQNTQFSNGSQGALGELTGGPVPRKVTFPQEPTESDASAKTGKQLAQRTAPTVADVTGNSAQAKTFGFSGLDLRKVNMQTMDTSDLPTKTGTQPSKGTEPTLDTVTRNPAHRKVTVPAQATTFDPSKLDLSRVNMQTLNAASLRTKIEKQSSNRKKRTLADHTGNPAHRKVTVPSTITPLDQNSESVVPDQKTDQSEQSVAQTSWFNFFASLLPNVFKPTQQTTVSTESVGQTCPIIVQQVPVLSQLDQQPWPSDRQSQEIARKEGGNCGYHALKNVQIMMEILAKTDSGKSLDMRPLKDFERYRQFMHVNFKKTHGATWLAGNEIENLRGRMNPTAPILIVEQVPHSSNELTENIVQTVLDFRKKQNARLGLIWNAGARTSLAHMGGTHWVGFVANKQDDKMTLYCMDSATTGMYVHAVKSLLCKTPDELEKMLQKQHVQHMQEDLNALDNRSSNNPATLQGLIEIMMVNWKDYGTLPASIEEQFLQKFKILWDSTPALKRKHLQQHYFDLISPRLSENSQDVFLNILTSE